MAEKQFHLEIVTPRKVIFSAAVTSFSAPGVVGSFQVLRSHAPLLSAINIGDVKVVDTGGKETHYATSGGSVEVRDNKVVLLAETAERVDEIDLPRAKAALDRARKRMDEKKPETDTDRARIALARAINRLKVAERQ
ncbi:MAG: F0F1 ATP synthase subunit epsilon [Bacteroidota bacterium]